VQPLQSRDRLPEEPASGIAAQGGTTEKDSPTSDMSPDAEQEPTDTSGLPTADESAPPPALDAGTLTLRPDLGNESLEPEIAKAVAPASAASLRLTESARQHLADGKVDDAMRELARAISLDPADAFAYYYLGRVYFFRKNYKQAVTFFRRAAIGFNGRPDWTAEAFSYQGICDEEMGKATDAVLAYKQALAAAPDNFRARIGYGRLATFTQDENVARPSANQDLAAPPPEVPLESAPAEEPPPPPPE